jgi:cytochrome c2
MDGQLLSQKNTHDLLSNIFARSEARASAYAYIEALIDDSARKTSWQMSEAAGFHTPYRFQHFLGRAV